MKFIYIMVLFSSMLFAMQKQIILGSYSVEENARNALITVQNQIKDDSRLSDALDIKSVKLENGLISGYTVVSVNAFESYSDLLPVMKIFKAYYYDAFVIKYPTENFPVREDMHKVEMKAKIENIREEDMSEDEILAQEKLAIQKNIVEEVVVMEEEIVEEVIIKEEKSNQDMEKLEELIEEVKEQEVTSATQSIDDIMKEVEQRHNEQSSFDNYYIIGALAIVALLVSFLIYKRTSRQEED